MSSLSNYSAADLISDFIVQNCSGRAFLVTGGACAFIVDAIGRNQSASYVCFQHEQSAAMAADAVWRTTGKVGVTISTSGPGATNLITGIACSWFDSIPALHITGQVNQSESRDTLGTAVRQAGFQETDIVSMVQPITKFAKKIESIEDLVSTLPNALGIALEGRMGPVLLDIPMNIQKAKVSSAQRSLALSLPKIDHADSRYIDISGILREAKRPLVLIGAGAALSGTAREIQNWCEHHGIPHVASWGALSYLNRSAKYFFGSIGVYGSRRANWLIQACDELLVLGSRLDNRQRTGNSEGFAPFARIDVLDIDREELGKYRNQSNYRVHEFDLRYISKLLEPTSTHQEWTSLAREVTHLMDDGFSRAVPNGLFNPYKAVRLAQGKFHPNAIVVSDCGANLCWVYQSYLPDDSFLFTAGGNSPMGYSLPAAIGAQLSNPDRHVYCFIGDGGLQMNLQELQTIVHYQLPVKVSIQNNLGYGIIKQFQDTYFEGRHFATGQGYSVPNFAKIAEAFGIPYAAVKSESELNQLDIPEGAFIVDMLLPPESLITPKTEMNRFIHDQFPYIQDDSISKLPYEYPKFPSLLRTKS